MHNCFHSAVLFLSRGDKPNCTRLLFCRNPRLLLMNEGKRLLLCPIIWSVFVSRPPYTIKSLIRVCNIFFHFSLLFSSITLVTSLIAVLCPVTANNWDFVTSCSNSCALVNIRFDQVARKIKYYQRLTRKCERQVEKYIWPKIGFACLVSKIEQWRKTFVELVCPRNPSGRKVPFQMNKGVYGRPAAFGLKYSRLL